MLPEPSYGKEKQTFLANPIFGCDFKDKETFTQVKREDGIFQGRENSR